MSKLITVSIGDVHGRDVWKDFTHGSTYDFEIWKTAVLNGGDAVSDFWKTDDPLHFMNVDKYIFIGDYVDSFTIANIEMKKNLEDIIFFKKNCPDRVVLLIGNHDVAYIVPNQYCSGNRHEMRHDFNKLFMDNIDLFQLAYQHEDTLWTHAGVTDGWLKILDLELFNPGGRFYKIIKERIKRSSPIADKLNLAWEMRLEPLFLVDRYSGGWSKWAGPVWVRPEVLNKHGVPNMKQVVGHTPQDNIKEVGNITYIDCLEYGDVAVYRKDFE